MNKEKEVINIFALMYKLRNITRKGWLDKNIKRFRIESVADHIYGCQMLAYAMYSEFKYDLDINRVILLLAVHEIGETIIGDITIDDMSCKDKRKLERETVSKLLDITSNSDLLRNLFNEFEYRKSKEAIFAYQIDKAECDLQGRLYEQDESFLDNYKKYEFTKEWVAPDIIELPFDDNFKDVLSYILDNDIKVKSKSNNKIQNVLSFYKTTNVLKDIQRTGEIIWNIKQEHYGSIAEHIYNVEMLAIAVYLVYGINIDITKVICMISVHELGEIKIGDISSLLKNDTDRDNEWNEAVIIANLLSDSKSILNNLKEFNDVKTNEAIYSKYCDKLAPDIISKIYDDLGLIDLEHQENNPLLNNSIVKKYLDNKKTFSEMWILYGQEVYKYPEPFMSISNYVLNNKVEEDYSIKI